MTQHRFSNLNTSEKLLDLISNDTIRSSLKGSAKWLTAAVDAAGNPKKCCRNTLYHEGGRIDWLYPNSNTAELISAWLDLAEILDEPSYTQRAIDYANGLLDDPVKGLYRGEAPEAQGLPWYWTDGGTYGGLYAMRMPFHFHRLYEKTGDFRYLEICDVIGKTLLNRQLPNGLVTAAYDPETGWMTEIRIGSRYVFAVATFATLWRITGNDEYRTAYEKAVSAMLALQNADGSFFQMAEPRTGKPLDTSIKLHFTAYILNALAEAHAVTGEEQLVECGKRISDHLAGVFYYHHTTPYCIGNVAEPADQTEAESAIQDSVGGLLWLGNLASEPVYRDIAVKLWMETWQHQLPLDREPGWAGAIIRGVKPDLHATLAGVPENRKHLHHAPTTIARCDLWFVVNHITASKRLLEIVTNR